MLYRPVAKDSYHLQMDSEDWSDQADLFVGHTGCFVGFVVLGLKILSYAQGNEFLKWNSCYYAFQERSFQEFKLFCSFMHSLVMILMELATK